MTPSAEDQAGCPAPPSAPATRSLLRSRRWLAVALIAGAALAASTFLGWPWLQGRLERRQGLRLAQQGRFADAEPLLQRALERRPDDLTVVKALVLGQLDADKLTKAEMSLGRWCALRPRDAEPFRRRLHLWLQLKRVPLALADGQHVLELEPDQDALRKQVTQWLAQTGRLVEAERECQRCLERRPNELELLSLLADIYQGQGRHAEAVAILDPLLRKHPGHTAARLAQALVYCEANQSDQAIPLLRQVLKEDSSLQQTARYHLSLALDRTGQTAEAEQMMAEFQGRQALAELHWRQSLEASSRSDQPAQLGLQVRFAEALLAVGKPDEARRLLEKILEQDPNLAAAHQMLAVLYDKQGQAARATEHRRRAEK